MRRALESERAGLGRLFDYHVFMAYSWLEDSGLAVVDSLAGVPVSDFSDFSAFFGVVV